MKRIEQGVKQIEHKRLDKAGKCISRHRRNIYASQTLSHSLTFRGITAVTHRARTFHFVLV